jgi:hypothetical protein
MKKIQIRRSKPRARKEYDFSQGVVGKYAARYTAGTNIVILDCDVAQASPDSPHLNDDPKKE